MGFSKGFGAVAAAAAFAVSASVAAAATVTISVQGFGSIAGGDVNIAGALAARDAFIGGSPVVASEDFEGFTACPGADCSATPLNTAVGLFTVDGANNIGASPVVPTDAAVIRSSTTNIFGRYNVDPSSGGTRWLDSNDWQEVILHTAPAGIAFNKFAFFLTDNNDAGSSPFHIAATVGGNTFNDTISGSRPNGALFLVTMSFSEVVSDVRISLSNDNRNATDGFGIDGLVAAIPLPAPALFLLTGMGALGGVAAIRRRRDTKADA